MDPNDVDQFIVARKIWKGRMAEKGCERPRLDAASRQLLFDRLSSSRQAF
jgi:hypothetical protein